MTESELLGVEALENVLPRPQRWMLGGEMEPGTGRFRVQPELEDQPGVPKFWALVSDAPFDPVGMAPTVLSAQDEGTLKALRDHYAFSTPDHEEELLRTTPVLEMCARYLFELISTQVPGVETVRSLARRLSSPLYPKVTGILLEMVGDDSVIVTYSMLVYLGSGDPKSPNANAQDIPALSYPRLTVSRPPDDTGDPYREWPSFHMHSVTHPPEIVQEIVRGYSHLCWLWTYQTLGRIQQLDLLRPSSGVQLEASPRGE